MGRNLVLDAGALIGLERGGQMAIVLAEQAHELGGSTVIPASVLAQVWRAGPKAARLARLLASSEVDALDEARAKQAGVRLGNRGGDDVVNSHVACCAVEREAVVATSDPGDISALLEPGEAVRTIAV